MLCFTPPLRKYMLIIKLGEWEVLLHFLLIWHLAEVDIIENVPGPLLTVTRFCYLPLQDFLLLFPTFLYKNEKFTAILLLLFHPSPGFHIHSFFQHLLIHFLMDNRLHTGKEKQKLSNVSTSLLPSEALNPLIHFWVSYQQKRMFWE